METWWVLKLSDVLSMVFEAPEGEPDWEENLVFEKLDGGEMSYAPGSYQILYGPCTEQEAYDYLDDLTDRKENP